MRQAIKAQRAPRKRPRSKGPTLPAIYIDHLMTLPPYGIGPTPASLEIGTSTSTLHKARDNGVASVNFEKSAKRVWEDLYAAGRVGIARPGDALPTLSQPFPPPSEFIDVPKTPLMAEAVHAPTAEGTVLLLVQVPRGREGLILPIIERIGGTVVVQA